MPTTINGVAAVPEPVTPARGITGAGLAATLTRPHMGARRARAFVRAGRRTFFLRTEEDPGFVPACRDDAVHGAAARRRGGIDPRICGGDQGLSAAPGGIPLYAEANARAGVDGSRACATRSRYRGPSGGPPDFEFQPWPVLRDS